ncbi:dnaK [Mytilus coruscus]|uniref:DnaK n=1 Tax=Mytilus coruscus TaxID=42192 RepID=A0A6J8CUG2_MYTCO|nr:dnaK [Mytilus coruscus]
MNSTDYNVPENHESISTSDYEPPEMVEIENEKMTDLPKIQEKINSTFDSCRTKSNADMHYINEINKNEPDVEILSATDFSYDFKPINSVVKKKFCLIVNIPTKHKQITNNSFIWDPNLLQKISQSRFKTVKEHIQTLQMKENNVWGTELEIIACTDLLNTDIYTFYNGSWIKYSSSQLCSKNKINVQAIYLQHQTGINHYEVVTTVTQKSRYQNRMQASPIQRKKYEFDRKFEVPKLKIHDCDDYFDDESKVLSKAEKKESGTGWTSNSKQERLLH